MGKDIVKKMNDNANVENKSEVLKNVLPLRPKIWKSELLDRFSAVLEMSDTESLLNDSLEKRTARLKSIKDSLDVCVIKPACIESFSNRILIAWIPKRLVLCETYEEYRNLCLEFSNYLDGITEVKIKINPSMINGDCNYNEHKLEEDTEYLEPKFTKNNFSYLKETKILHANYEID